jgi:hypothetical protein
MHNRMPDILVHIGEPYNRGPVHLVSARQSGISVNKVLWDGVKFPSRTNEDRDCFSFVWASIFLKLVPTLLNTGYHTSTHLIPDTGLSILDKD